MVFWQDHQSIKYIAFGLHANRPAKAPAQHNAWYSIDTGIMYLSDLNRNWVQIGVGNIPLVITTDIAIMSNQQIVSAKTTVEQGATLTIQSGGLLRFVG